MYESSVHQRVLESSESVAELYGVQWYTPCNLGAARTFYVLSWLQRIKYECYIYKNILAQSAYICNSECRNIAGRELPVLFLFVIRTISFRKYRSKLDKARKQAFNKRNIYLVITTILRLIYGLFDDSPDMIAPPSKVVNG